MQESRNNREIVPSVKPEIAPVYSRAMLATDQHYKVMIAFVKAQMVKGIDYGKISGCNKPILLKPGAEKLCRLFNLRPRLEVIHSVVDFDKALFFYHYRCSLYLKNELVAQGDGSCNSREKKYEKQQHKIFDLTNTICKMAQKRALVAAVLSSCGASQFFSQDLEEISRN